MSYTALLGKRTGRDGCQRGIGDELGWRVEHLQERERVGRRRTSRLSGKRPVKLGLALLQDRLLTSFHNVKDVGGTR
jgi:hypothetical protein